MLSLSAGSASCDFVAPVQEPVLPSYPVAPFVDAISSSELNEKADINKDGTVDLLVVAPFLDLLSGG